MVLWKEWRETFSLVILSVVAICTVSLIRWKGWRLEFFEIQFWGVAILCLPFILLFLGAGAIAGERENDTFDTLLAKPIKLSKIFLTKYLVRQGNVLLLLAVLTVVFLLIRPTHNVKMHDLARGLVVLFAFLSFFLAVSFCVSCFTGSSAKALVASIVLIYMILFMINSSPFFRYAWFWRHSLEEMWIEYFLFYGILSLVFLAVSAILFSRRILFNYDWKLLAVAGIIFFLIFVRSVSTTFWFFAEAVTTGDMQLVQTARGSVHEILEAISYGKHSTLLQQLLTTASSSAVERDLIAELSNSNPAIRNTALKILTNRSYDRKKDGLEAVPAAAVLPLLNDPNSDVRHSALNFATRFKCREAVPELVELIDDPNSSIRTRAVHALAAVEGQTAAPYLMKALKDQNPRVSDAAAYQLCYSLDYGEAQGEIVRLMFESRVKNTRRSMATYLGRLRSAPACDALLEALSDDDQ